MIAIIDYGIGNIGSIYNMLVKSGHSDVFFARTSEDILRADKYILPGVGAFDAGMKMLNESGMRQELDRQVKEKEKPVLGICLGMQMLGNSSEEGKEKGLGYIPFDCVKFASDTLDIKVPHMGWDYVEIKKDSPIVMNPEDGTRFYFVHSYYAVCDSYDDVLFECDYGVRFAAGVCRGNVFGTQFHPEKSHKYGKWLLKNFADEV